jgi:glutamate---cysteine ligase / carboxylate-amine ligase
MSLEFAPSDDFSVGMEIELQLLDAAGLDLTDGIMQLIEFFPDSEQVKPEFIQNTVEIASPVCADVTELAVSMQGLSTDVLSRADQLSMALCGAGTHPFSQTMALVTPYPRYLAMEQQYSYIAHTQITFATHVHVGVDSGDEAVQVMRELKPMLSLLIGVSANSPYWRGYDTGFASYRRLILAMSRSYGQPPDFANWAEFCEVLDHSRAAGLFDSVHDIHWDLRPRPHLGTVEIRAMDAQSTVAQACALAALIRTMVLYLRRIRGTGDGCRLQALPWWLHKDNCYLAARDGIDAKLIADESGRWVWLKDALLGLLNAMSGDVLPADALFLTLIKQQVDSKTLGYQCQRDTYSATNSWQTLVETLCRQWREQEWRKQA